jgi:GTP pyrophosphokinase
VFCFTPKGDLIALPRAATPVDFAYAVHSQVGDRCVGAKINGRMAPLRTQLQNGDQVEVVTSRNQTPSPTWERFVVTGKARACIRRFIRTQQRAQYLELGRSILTKDFRHDGHELTEKALEGALKKLKCDSVEELYALVGAGNLTGREVIAAVFPGLKPAAEEKTPGTKRGRPKKATGKESNAIPITGLIPGMAINFAGCCHPLPGDRIVGIVTTGKGVTIHTIDCETLESFADAPERWLDVSWHVDPAKAEGHVGRLHVVVANEPGSLGSLSTVIGKSEGNITNLKITNRSADFFEMMIDVEVKDVRHLTNIIAALRATPAINTVERARG